MVTDSIDVSSSSLSACPVCREANFSSYKLGLLLCDACGVVLSPTIWQLQANEQMEEEWFGEDYSPATSFWVVLFEKWNNRTTMQRLSLAKLPGNRLLEIGVGSGSFLNAARVKGYTVTGCDLSATICERVHREYGIVMHQTSLEALEGENLFDIVVINHVLEHVQQPMVF